MLIKVKIRIRIEVTWIRNTDKNKTKKWYYWQRFYSTEECGLDVHFLK
jgi:hypothetical protein